jgi:hypothetical protein
MPFVIPPRPGDTLDGANDTLWLTDGVPPISDDLSPDGDIPVISDELIEKLQKRLDEYAGRPEDTPPRFSISAEDRRLLLPTSDLVRAFDNITARTGNEDAAISHKRRLVVAVRNRKLIPDDILRLPTVYVGAGADLEYPLCLGCRHLIMVDPNDELLNAIEVADRIRRATGREPAVSPDGELSFPFDFGAGPETVLVRIEHAWYNPTGDAAGRTPVFSPPDAIGMVLGYQLLDIEIDPESVVKRIVSGGVMLANRPLGSIFRSMTKAENAIFCYSHDEGERKALVMKKYAERGFRFIPLDCETGFQYTFAAKVNSAEPPKNT